MSYAAGRGVGILAYYLLPGRRRLAVMNIRSALGIEARDADRLARKSFISLGLLGTEFLRFSGRRRLLAERVKIGGEEYLREALSGGKGAILLHAHLGNWELAGQALAVAGYRINPIVQVQTGGFFNRLIDRERRAAGIAPIERGFTLREMLRALKRGELVLIMPDQSGGRSGVPVPFFGREASTARGLAVIARLSGAPVVPYFARRISPGRIEARFRPPLPMALTDDEMADTIANMTSVNELLEEVIRESPEQWLWMHDRWRGPEGGRGKAGRS